MRVADDVVIAQWADRAQHIHLAVTQVAGVEADRRLHRHQAEQLQQVVLQHVLERAHAVVVPGPALQRERLVPDDVYLRDVRAVPYGFENAVGQPGAEDVLHGCHGQEVVDPEHRLFRDHPERSVFNSVASSRVSPNGFSSTIELPCAKPAP